MKLLHKEIIGLPVYTRSEVYLGIISGLEIDLSHQNICYYAVGSRFFLNRIFQKKLFIHRSQVVQLMPSRLIVDDALLSQKIFSESAESTVKSQESLVEEKEKLPTLPSASS